MPYDSSTRGTRAEILHSLALLVWKLLKTGGLKGKKKSQPAPESAIDLYDVPFPVSSRTSFWRFISVVTTSKLQRHKHDSIGRPREGAGEKGERERERERVGESGEVS